LPYVVTFQTYSYYSQPTLHNEWCTSSTSLVIAVKSGYSSESADILMKVYTENDGKAVCLFLTSYIYLRE